MKLNRVVLFRARLPRGTYLVPRLRILDVSRLKSRRSRRGCSVHRPFPLPFASFRCVATRNPLALTSPHLTFQATQAPFFFCASRCAIAIFWKLVCAASRLSHQTLPEDRLLFEKPQKKAKRIGSDTRYICLSALAPLYSLDALSPAWLAPDFSSWVQRSFIRTRPTTQLVPFWFRTLPSPVPLHLA